MLKCRCLHIDGKPNVILCVKQSDNKKNTLQICFFVAHSIILLALCFMSNSAEALQPEEIFRMNRDAVGTVLTQQGQGSGVVIGAGVVLTNCHVVAEANSIEFVSRKRYFSAKLIAGNQALDLCKLFVPGLNAHPVKIRSLSNIKIGERVYAIGGPEKFELTISEGLVSGLRDIEDSFFIQTTAPISHGSSGGGLFDSVGNLIGITSGSWVNGQNINFAIPASFSTRMKGMSYVSKEDEVDGIRITPEIINSVFTIFERQDFNGAVVVGEKWVKLDPNSPQGWTVLGFGYLNTDRYVDAESALHQAVYLDPSFSPATYGLSLLYDLKGDVEEKTRYIRQCADNGRLKNSYLQGYRFLCMVMGGNKKGLQELRKLVSEHKFKSWLFTLLGQAYLSAHDFDRAREASDRALVINPNSVWAYDTAAAALIGAHDYIAASLYVGKALKISPSSPGSLELEVMIALLQGDRETAKMAFSQLQSVNPLRANILLDRFRKK